VRKTLKQGPARLILPGTVIAAFVATLSGTIAATIVSDTQRLEVQLGRSAGTFTEPLPQEEIAVDDSVLGDGLFAIFAATHSATFLNRLFRLQPGSSIQW
jgi:hypothetical protein